MDRTERTTTEVLQLQLDNMRQEMQQMQVENKKLRVKVQLQGGRTVSRYIRPQTEIT